MTRIRITKKGKNPKPNAPWKGKCSFCHAEAEVDSGAIPEDPFEPLIGQWTDLCPDCNSGTITFKPQS